MKIPYSWILAFFLTTFWDNLGCYYRLNMLNDDGRQMACILIYFQSPVHYLRKLYIDAGPLGQAVNRWWHLSPLDPSE